MVTAKNALLESTKNIDIQTSFRFELNIDPTQDASLGLTEAVSLYIQSSDLPSAPGDPIVWSMPGGMKNNQAGKRTTQSISMTFLVPTTANQGSIYTLLEKWAHATYDLNKGTNIGKANYCTDALSIFIKGEDNAVKYVFHLLRAQVTNCNYGSVNSEDNSFIRVSATFVYDNYEVKDGTGKVLTGIVVK